MSPEEFKQKMLEFEADNYKDIEEIHSKMDDLMCEVLSMLGYGDGVEVFQNTEKWYG